MSFHIVIVLAIFEGNLFKGLNISAVQIRACPYTDTDSKFAYPFFIVYTICYSVRRTHLLSQFPLSNLLFWF